MSTSNSYFSGVSNDEVQNRIIASSADVGTITAQSIKTDTLSFNNVNILGLPTTNNVVKPNAAYYAMSPADMALMTRGHVLYQDNGSASIITVNTADSAAEATRLLALFNITDSTTTRLIRLSRVNTIANVAVSIGSPSVVGISFNYVKFCISGGTVAEVKQFSAGGSTRDAYILVYRGSDYLNNKTIVFDVIGPA